ncbi:MAG: hypothetical protein V1649_00615 [Patescibacteria group bacterium]
MFSKIRKILFLVGIIIVIEILVIAWFIIFKKVEKKEIIKKEIIKVQEEKQSHFLSKEEKEKFGIDPNIEVKIRQVQGDLGLINVIEFPTRK